MRSISPLVLASANTNGDVLALNMSRATILYLSVAPNSSPPRAGVGETEERSRTGGGGFPVFKRPFDIRLGRPAGACMRRTSLTVVFTTV